jgi:hypothetical protein
MLMGLPVQVKKGILIIAASLLLFPVKYSSGQALVYKGSPAGVSIAGKGVTKVFIPPPKEFYNRSGSKGASIKVYYQGFTSAPKTAYEYAVSILASLLPDNVHFTIRATWGPLVDANVLGSTAVNGYIGGKFIDAINPSVYYPVALAEKIAGKTLNTETEGDILMTINSKIPWYTGTDGNIPAEKYDLVTVVLHEMIHGLGFVDSFNSSNSLGSYGLNSIPLIYDTFVEDLSGNIIINHYANNSSELNTALTNGQVYFNGPVLDSVTSGGRARLYAPSTYSAGSSIAHLDESSTARKNALMTPILDKQEVIHSPGTISMAILGDLGWINTRISHKQFSDTEEHLSSLAMKASVVSDTTFDRDRVGMVYSLNDFAVSDTLFMLPPVSGDTFRVNLPVSGYNFFLSYYFYATDHFGRIYRLPSAAITTPYKFFIGTDTVKPVLDHKPPQYLFDKTPGFKVVATATDNIGIDTVYAEYRKNNGTFRIIGLKNDSLDIYSGTIDLKALTFTSADSLQYRIIAKDSSSSANIRYLPASGYFTVKFESLLPVVTAYTTNFTGASSEFINRGFSIIRPAQFTSEGLHSRHPYESPEKENASIEYTSVLKYPLKVDDSGIVLNFNEIVLVEPGESGSVYGSPDFYDYVVIEASKDFGTTWFAMADGYDSRINLLFLNAYNGSISGNNSTYTGTQDMFTNHTIDIRTFDKFGKGDTLVIRFRLWSDPFAHGWGWALDDLSIKSVASGVNRLTYGKLKIYPNPGNGVVKIYPDEEFYGRPLKFRVINQTGIVMREISVAGDSEYTLDISSLPPGIYEIILQYGPKLSISRYTKLR